MAFPNTLNRYLLLLAQEHLEFRLPEIKSLLSLLGGRFSSHQEIHGKSPFWILSIPSEDIARNLMKRTVCANAFLETNLKAEGRNRYHFYSIGYLSSSYLLSQLNDTSA